MIAMNRPDAPNGLAPRSLARRTEFRSPPQAEKAAPRGKRPSRNRFGAKAYAAEDLIAKLGAAFLCDHLVIWN